MLFRIRREIFIFISALDKTSPETAGRHRSCFVFVQKPCRNRALTPEQTKNHFIRQRLDGIALEDEYGNSPAQRAELDWLLYNKPLEYTQIVLKGEMGHYLSLGCDHGRLED